MRAPSQLAVSNGLGVAGMLAVVAAVCALTDWRWALLLLGGLAVAVSWLTSRSTGGTASVGAAPTSTPAPRRRLASVERAA